MREPANKSLLTDVSRLCSYRCTIIVPTDMREPANKSLLTDVSRLCSYRCTIIVPTTSLAFVEGTGCGAQST
jgi:hypothetical protein